MSLCLSHAKSSMAVMQHDCIMIVHGHVLPYGTYSEAVERIKSLIQQYHHLLISYTFTEYGGYINVFPDGNRFIAGI